ncbi:HepT-like ribonuclease domain-containing protein [Clostridium butyricum]
MVNDVILNKIAVHDYQNVNMKVVQTIIEKHLNDFEEYTSAIKKMIF